MASRVKMLARNTKFQILGVILLVVVLMGLIGPFLARRDPYAIDYPERSPPSTDHILGTTELGQDCFSRMLVGIRNSSQVAIIVAVLAMLVALMMGGVGGYIGGLVDESLNMVTNVFLIFPTIPFLIVLQAMVGASTIFFVALVISITQWPWAARSIRSQVLSLKERNFVDIAKVSGKGNLDILFREILPNMLSYVIVAFVTIFAAALVAVAGLSMIGLGPDVVSLGTILHLAQQHGAHHSTLGIQWWWMFPPGFVLMIYAGTMIAMVSVIDDILNPRLRSY